MGYFNFEHVRMKRFIAGKTKIAGDYTSPYCYHADIIKTLKVFRT